MGWKEARGSVDPEHRSCFVVCQVAVLAFLGGSPSQLHAAVATEVVAAAVVGIACVGLASRLVVEPGTSAAAVVVGHELGRVVVVRCLEEAVGDSVGPDLVAAVTAGPGGREKVVAVVAVEKKEVSGTFVEVSGAVDADQGHLVAGPLADLVRVVVGTAWARHNDPVPCRPVGTSSAEEPCQVAGSCLAAAPFPSGLLFVAAAAAVVAVVAAVVGAESTSAAVAAGAVGIAVATSSSVSEAAGHTKKKTPLKMRRGKGTEGQRQQSCQCIVHSQSKEVQTKGRKRSSTKKKREKKRE